MKTTPPPAPDWHDEWLARDGFWQRALQQICRYHLPGAQRFVNWLCQRALDRFQESQQNWMTQQVLLAVWETGKSMKGTLDDDGTFHIEEIKSPPPSSGP